MPGNAPRLIAAALLCLLIAGCGGSSKVEQDAKELEAFETAKDAYVYAYPLMTMDLMRRVTTNVASPEGTSAPMGQFAKLREYPNASFNAVTAPNADTLYTIIWLDLSNQPWVISIPDLKGRYALFPFLDGWTDVFQVPGKRTTGTAAQKYAITGPGWSGTLPAGVNGIQVADGDGLVAWSNLLHRNARGLQSSPRAARSDECSAAVVVWEAIHTAARNS
jgi:hypothetical protein